MKPKPNPLTVITKGKEQTRVMESPPKFITEIDMEFLASYTRLDDGGEDDDMKEPPRRTNNADSS